MANSVHEQVPEVRSAQGPACRGRWLVMTRSPGQSKGKPASPSPQAAQWNLVGVIRTQYDRQSGHI